MVSPELIRRYPFFADLSPEQIVIVARAGNEISVDAGHYFFRAEEMLEHFFVVVEGQVGILINLPDERVSQPLSRQLTGNLITREFVVTRIEPGEVFGWSALVPPHHATSTGKSLIPSRVVVFDCKKIREAFEQDWYFGYLMTQKAAQLIRERLRDMRMEALSDLLAQSA
jgi:CRP-like cAMP-binding protein